MRQLINYLIALMCVVGLVWGKHQWSKEGCRAVAHLGVTRGSLKRKQQIFEHANCQVYEATDDGCTALCQTCFLEEQAAVMGMCMPPDDPCTGYYVCHMIPESHRCVSMLTHNYFDCYLKPSRSKH